MRVAEAGWRLINFFNFFILPLLFPHLPHWLIMSLFHCCCWLLCRTIHHEMLLLLLLLMASLLIQ